MTARTPARYDWKNALFNDKRLTKHFTHPRRSKISHVTLHHMTIVAKGSGSGTTSALEACYTTWQTREASANYGVSGDQVWQYVSDNDAAWSDANSASNHSTLSIEHANSTAGPKWEISPETMATGQHLVAALHLLYGLGRPTRKTVRVHQDYYATACPGPYMMAHLTGYIASAGVIYDQMKAGKLPAPAPTPKPKPVAPPAVPPVVALPTPEPDPPIVVPTVDTENWLRKMIDYLTGLLGAHTDPIPEPEQPVNESFTGIRNASLFAAATDTSARNGSMKAGDTFTAVASAKDEHERTWYKNAAGLWALDYNLKVATAPSPAPDPALPEHSTDIYFRDLSINQYGEQYTGGVRAIGPQQAVYNDANPGFASVYEVNRNGDHERWMTICGGWPKVYSVRAKRNNHQYAQADEWEYVAAVEKLLGSYRNSKGFTQNRGATFSLWRHKASGILQPRVATHFSSATGGYSSSDSQKSQILEATTMMRYVNTPNLLPGWVPENVLICGDFNTSSTAKGSPREIISRTHKGLRDHGIKVGDSGLKTFQGWPNPNPWKKGGWIDDMFSGPGLELVNARLITSTRGCSDHLGLVATYKRVIK